MKMSAGWPVRNQEEPEEDKMKSWTSKWTIISTLTLSMAAFAACGGDGGEDVGDGESASNEGAGAGVAEGGSDASGSTGSGTQGLECGPSSINQDDPCELCIGTKCTAEALACCEQDGCLDVVFCAAENGCNGIDCYAPDKCQAEIDAAGLEVATTYAQAMGDCALAECAMECESKVGDGS
jgi:hypothetical protein